MQQRVTRQHTGVVESAVFVDRYGRRRLFVITAGLVVALALAGWLALLIVGLAVVSPDAAPPVPPG